jgi:holo-[acyl-carrier protein] synthase
MILGFGLDVVEVARIARQLESGSAERFLARVFTQRERSFCERFRDRANRYAARFAAKEAASKALGAPAGIAFHDVEVVREGGAPRLVFSGVAEETARALRVERAHLKITHDGGVAAAAVILEGPGDRS